MQTIHIAFTHTRTSPILKDTKARALRERQSRSFTRKRGKGGWTIELQVCPGVDVLAKLVCIQKSTHFPSFLLFRPPLRGWCATSLSLSPSFPPSKPFSLSLFLFSLVHSPTYPPLRAITLVARQKGRGRGVEGNGGTGWKVCKGMYINDVRNTAIDIELILKLAMCVCVRKLMAVYHSMKEGRDFFFGIIQYTYSFWNIIYKFIYNIRSNFDQWKA